MTRWFPRRSRLADFMSSCHPEAGSISGCLRENYADCLLAYSGLIGERPSRSRARQLACRDAIWKSAAEFCGLPMT